MIRKVPATFMRAWPPRTWPLMAVLAAWPVWFCFKEFRAAYDYWAHYNSYLRAVPMEPQHYDPYLMSVSNMRHEKMVEMLVWGGGIFGVLVLVLLLVWFARYLRAHSVRSDPGGLSMRTSTHQADASIAAGQPAGGAPAPADNRTRNRPSAASGSYAVVQRPNQELLLRAMNMYRDVMGAVVLDALRQAYGQGATDAIRTSLSDDAAGGFERELARSGGVLEEALDIGHFRPVVENSWDRCFSALFRHDGTIPGTLGWINGARNRAVHPGTTDLDAGEVVAALSNIAKVMDYAGATDVAQTLGEMRARVRATPSPPARQAPAAETRSTTSKCANARCDAFNTHEVGADGRASLRCRSCSAEYSALSFVVLRFDRYRDRGTPQGLGVYNYSVRFRLPNGREDIVEFSHHSPIGADRGDTISVSFDKRGEWVFLLNCGIDRTWFFNGGDYRRFWQHPLTYVIIVCILAIASCQYAIYQLRP